MSNANGGAVVKASDRMMAVRDLLDRQKDGIAKALPKHITPERMLRVALTCLRTTPKLLNCEPMSIVKAVMQAAQLGLEPDGVLGHAYLIPYGKECQLLPGYRGLIELTRQSGQISTIAAEVVHEGDEFDFLLGDDPHITHRPSLDQDRSQKPVTHVYAIARLKDGGVQRAVMTKADIDAHAQKYSRAFGSKESPWRTAWSWMAKKTVLKQLIKLLPVSVEVQRLIQREDYATEGVLQVEPRGPLRDPPRGLDELADHIAGTLEAPPEEPESEPEDETPKTRTSQPRDAKVEKAMAAYKRSLAKCHTDADRMEVMEEVSQDGRLNNAERLELHAHAEALATEK